MTPKSGKREAGWIVFTVVTLITVGAMWLHTNDKDMTAFVSLLVITWPTSIAAVIGPHIVHHVKPPK